MKKLTKGQRAVLRRADRGDSLGRHRFIVDKLEKKGILSSCSDWGSSTSRGEELLSGKKKKTEPAQTERILVHFDRQYEEQKNHPCCTSGHPCGGACACAERAAIDDIEKTGAGHKWRR